MQIIENCMKEPNAPDDWELKDPHNGEVREVVSAKALWQQVAQNGLQKAHTVVVQKFFTDLDDL